MSQLHGGARLGLAVVALIVVAMSKPVRALAIVVMIGLFASILGPLLSAALGTIPWTELAPMKKWLLLDGAIATILIACAMMRAPRK